MFPFSRLARSRRGSSRFGWSVLVLSLLTFTVTGTASALMDPDPPPDSGGSGEFVLASNGFDWTRPDRFTAKADGRYNWHYDEATATYDPQYVLPTRWPVDFRGCRTVEDYEANESGPASRTVNTYTFVSADGQSWSGQRCNVRMWFPREASYQVRMSVTDPDGFSVGSWQQTVVVKDLLIVSIGDSYASGEGNPEYARQEGQEYGDWVDDRCHRSSYSGPARAAYLLERRDPKSTVTFLSFACSGGTINVNAYADPLDTDDPYKPMDPNRMNGSGILGPYMGAQPPDPEDFTDKLPSQIDQIRSALGAGQVPAEDLRQIDALVMSAGGNDAGFGLLATACLVSDYCLGDEFKYTGIDGETKVSLRERAKQDIAAMPARYRTLADALDPRSLQVNIGATFITEYPDPGTELRSDSGKVEECEEILEDIMWGLAMEIEGRQWIRGSEQPLGDSGLGDRTELGFARQVFLPGLNATIKSAASQWGWVYVDGISQGFQGHGYCVGPNDGPDPARYVQTAAMAAKYQGPDAREKTKGTLHPNVSGHGVYRDRIVAAAEQYLAGVTPDGNLTYEFDLTPPPPTTPPTISSQLTPSANAAGWLNGPATVTVTAQEGGSAVQYVEHQVDGGTWQLTTGSSVSFQVTGDGLHSVAYRAVDSQGNTSAPASATVRIDTTAPTATIAAPAAGGVYLLFEEVTASYTCSDATSGVATCAGPVQVGQPFDTSLAGLHSFAATATDAAGNTATVLAPYRVVYDFGGFLPPIDPLPTLNSMKAGGAVPVKFSLGGDQGLDIFTTGYPKSQTIACDSSDPVDVVEQTVTSGGSSLTYNPLTDTYSYVWKTDKAWAGTCRQFVLAFTDGSIARANFNLK